MSTFRRRLLLGGAILVMVLAGYWPAMRGGTIWDDDHHVTENSLIKARDGLYRFWCTTEAPDYYPLTSTTWWLEWRLWGADPTGYHVVNILLHAANAILIWLILERLKMPGAWLAALLFALHPVNVPSVAWIAERKNTLAMFFAALTVLFHLRSLDERSARWYWLALGAFLLALLSKSAVVMLPVVLLACVWWLKGRIERRHLWRSAPFFALSLLLGLVTVWFQYNRAMTGEPVRTDSFFARLAGAGWAVWFYLWKAVLPVQLTMVYPKWALHPAHLLSYVPVILLAGFFGLLWRFRTTWGRASLFALGCFVAMLFPVLGFLDQGFYQHSLVSDHWQYFSIPAFVALIAAVLAKGRRTGSIAAVLLAGVLFALTLTRAQLFGSPQRLWEDTLRKNPQAWVAHNNLAVAFLARGEFQKAAVHSREALNLGSRNPRALHNLAVALAGLREYDAAIKYFQQVTKSSPKLARPHQEWANVLMSLDRPEEALAQYQKALELDPDSTEARLQMATALHRLGRTGEAIEQIHRVMQDAPRNAIALHNLATILIDRGELEPAIAPLEKAIELNPNYAEAHFGLGVVLARLNRPVEAGFHFGEALRIKPDYAEAHNNLGTTLYMRGDAAKAAEHFREALRLKPDYADAYENLSNVLARSPAGP